MASKTKTKPKAKKKKTSNKAPRIKKRVKKTAPKKKTKSKIKSASKTKRAAARAPTPLVKPAAPAAPPGAERIGIVTHYYSHLSVAIIQLETGNMRAGDVIHIKGHTSDFTQPVESLEIDHVHVDQVNPGQSFGLRVTEHAREHDIVYKAKT